MMQQFQGIPASSGIAIGPVWRYLPSRIEVDRQIVTDSDVEWQRLQSAIARTRTQLDDLIAKARVSVGEEEAAIFAAHRLFLDDPELIALMEPAIRQQHLNAAAAVHDAFEQYAQALDALDDAYLQARAADVRDVAQRLLRNLQDAAAAPAPLTAPAIILAEDLTPSDTIQFERSKILGLCTQRGGPTSHTAILARALGVPAVVAAPLPLAEIADGTTAILDGDLGQIIIDPAPETLAAARQRLATWQNVHDAQVLAAKKRAVTRDGHAVEVVANIGGIEDAQQALAAGAEGVGLFRTEFLYLDRTSMPDEGEQIALYRQVFDLMAGRPVVVRTLDIGGDKPAAYLDVAPEPNPFLGWRAIRMITERPDVLKSQFRALLIAAEAANADLRIMLPLVSNLHEVRQARTLYEDVRGALRQEGHRLSQPVQFGMMVEVPSAALLADHFAALVDFFSIGTNDLTQYTLAVDRTNERVAPLASPYHPAVLKLIAMTIAAAHEQGKWVGLCGELAGDPLAAPLLLGLGLDEFSMAPAAIPEVKARIRACSLAESQELASRALALGSPDEVISLLEASANRRDR